MNARAKQAPLMRGYDIRIQRQGSCWMNEKAHGYAPVDQLPAEWEAVKADPSVIAAVVFPSSQRTWRADKRKHLAEYHAAAVVAA